jgi:hypothetical protein
MKNGLDANPIHEFFRLFDDKNDCEDATFYPLGLREGV